ncbi:hypothetical protein [Streptomyces sp. ME19-01-6]|uniref:hypothetical protein n=1 Tax=Streptomyces sp. ME19-01-6 TaxID=3028686 RepID=UPI00299F9C07|nr:hypothetical protein [Streptomyces sp. ME19-01-6]MDX3233446.1 hypothetical protein [Streptomyces sp. ME19-01-6]
MTIDLSLLETAATKWDEAAKKFEAVQKIYDSKVKSVGLDGSWTGQAQLVARPNMQVTGEQFTAAPKEARAIASVLRDAHSQFVELRGKVKSAVADAVKAGMKVSDAGIASYDYSQASASDANAARHDPELRNVEQSWTRYIEAAVRAVDDADQGVKLALKAAVADPNLVDAAVNGFNGKAEGDIEKVEAKEAKELATKLNSGDKLSDKEMAEFQRLFRDNEHNKAFSQTFLAGIGAKGTIELTNKFFDLAKGDDKKNFRALEKGLATTLASATKSPSDPFYKKWREDLKKAGIEKYDVDVVHDKIDMSKGHGQGARGYQSLVTLMKQGKGYSSRFLSDLTDDMIAAERKDKNIWDLYGEFSGKDDGWFANDPVDGALDLMSRDPKTATQYLDPKADGGNDRLKYLLRDRDWDLQNTTIWRGNIEVGSADASEADVRSGFGRALEAAATGNVPGTDHTLGYHTDAEARVMHNTIKILDDGRSGADIPAGLRTNLGHMLVDYTPETHEILTGTGPYMDKDGVWHDGTGGKDAHMSVPKESLTRIMRGVAEDGKAFGEMYDAERYYSAGTLSKTDFSNPNERAAAIEGASHVFGFYDGISSDIVRDKKNDAISWANHFQTAEFVITGGLQAGASALKGQPTGFITDAAYRILYAGVYDWKEDQIAQANAAAAQETEYHFTTGQKQVNHMVSGWAQENGHGINSGLSRHLVGSGQERYDSARTEALIYLD